MQPTDEVKALFDDQSILQERPETGEQIGLHKIDLISSVKLEN